MDATFEAVSRLYTQGESIKRIARRTGISEQKARRILITLGLYTTPDIAYVAKRMEAGADIDTIATEMGMARGTVIAMTPYSKGQYNAEHPTLNALRIRKSRASSESIHPQPKEDSL